MAAGVAAFILVPMKKSIAEAFTIAKEGFRSNAYLDTGGVWTFGYGSTYHYDLRRPVRQGDTITKEDALRYLRIYLDEAKREILQKAKVALNQNELDALMSFYYNLGPDQFFGSTLWRLLNKGTDRKIVANQFDKWIYDNGVIVPGLITRRAKEKALFLKPM